MSRERKAQKLRTRQALLAGARDLAADGRTVTVAEAAQVAGISKATAYRYFSDPQSLVAEAALDVKVADTATILGGETDPRRRVHLVTDYYRDIGRRNDAAFRAFLSRVLADWDPDSDMGERGARRIPALEVALAPVRDSIAPSDFDDLIMALASSATGFEQHIGLSDICRLEPEEADRVARIVVDALLDRYLT